MKKTLFFALLFILFSSCANNDDDVSLIDSALKGKWVLNNAICFCFFGDDFDFSEHKIDFNTKKSTMIIESTENALFIHSSGTFGFRVNGKTITINGNLKYNYKIKENKLELSFVDNPDIADDEITLIYTKI